MKVDAQTLCDLEVIRGAAATPTLVDLLDRTSTRGGRRALQRRLTTPLGSVEEIHRVQAAVGFLRSHPEAARDLPPAEEVEAVARYLDSNLAILARTRGPGIWWEAALIRVRFPELAEEAGRGTAHVRSFLARLRRLEKGLRAGPPGVAGLADALGAHLEGDELKSIDDWSGGGPRSAATLRLDRLIRGEARDPLRALIDVVHELDALLSMARATEELGFTMPEVGENQGELRLEGVFHPFLAEAVPNDLVLASHEQVLFLTGPNMAGKTTYLKACGLVVLLAHCGMGVPARHARMAFTARLLTAVRTEDSLWNGVSYFQAEARRVRGVLDAVLDEGRSLVIIDELFRGTNVKDAQDATSAVLRGFCRIGAGSFLVASHLSEVGDELEPLDAVVVSQMSGTLARGTVEFDYRVRPGVSGQRLGMEVLRREGVLDALESLETTSVLEHVDKAASP